MATGYWPQYRNELGTLVGLFFFCYFNTMMICLAALGSSYDMAVDSQSQGS